MEIPYEVTTPMMIDLAFACFVSFVIGFGVAAEIFKR